MKLLICTQKIDKNDPILGFFHEWVVRFSNRCEKVIVICLYEGTHNLPENVKVLTLGKERGNTRFQYVRIFLGHIFRENKNYDSVFVHMNQIYLAMGGLFWRIMGKKVALWYSHRSIDMNLKIATFFANHIFTAASESFNIKSDKVNVVGHGIDLEKFRKTEEFHNEKFSILSVGRITRIKNLDTLIQTASILKNRGYDFCYKIVGPIVTEDDKVYLCELQSVIKELNLEKEISFEKAVPNDQIRQFFWKSDINVNLTPDGGMDKVVLEGIASSIVPLVSNRAFLEVFGPYSNRLMFEFKNPEDLANKIEKIYKMKDKTAMLQNLNRKLQVDFGLDGLINKIITIMIR